MMSKASSDVALIVTCDAPGQQMHKQSSFTIIHEDLSYFRKGPLPADLRWEVDRVHMRNRLPIFSSTRVGKEWDGEGEIGESIP